MGLLVFGTIAVAAMLVMYALEERSHWFVLGFGAASAAAALYGLLIEAWPFAGIEVVWSAVAARRWWRRYWPAHVGTVRQADPVRAGGGNA